MPAWLAEQNQQGVPAHAPWLTKGMVQIFLILNLVSQATYLALISLSTAMILIPNLFSAIHGLKPAWTGRVAVTAGVTAGITAGATAGVKAAAAESHTARDISVTALASVCRAWLLYAAGLKYLLLSALLLLMALASAWMLWDGRLSL